MRGVCRVLREVTIARPQSRPSVQTIHAEHESDFCFNLSNIIRSRVLLVPPHHLPNIVHSRVFPSPCITRHSPCSPLQPLRVLTQLPAAAHHARHHNPSQRL